MLLTFDLGTSRLKVALFENDGRLVGQAAARHAIGAAAHEPDRWWEAAIALTRRLAPDDVAAISLSGRAGVAVFVDATGRVVAGSWADRRHAEIQARLLADHGSVALSAYGSALLAKVLWLRANDPGAAEAATQVLYGKDFLLFRLTGDAVTDPTSGPDRAAWDAGVLAAEGIDPALLPRLADPWSVAGTLTRDAADQLGLRTAVPVVVGGHDGICANVGAGAGIVGGYAVTLGTHAVVRAVMRQAPPGAHRFYGLPPDRHVIGGNAVMAGGAADWFADACDAPLAVLDAEADAVDTGAGGVVFLPFLGGRLAPEPRAGATGTFFGLRTRHGRAHLHRAVLEGGAHAVRAVYDQVREWCGAPARVAFTGTGAGSAVWRGIIADVLGESIAFSDTAVEGRGAAIFASVALGYHHDVDTAAAAMVHPAGVAEPDARRVARYRELHEEWLRVDSALRPLDSSTGR